MKLSSAEFLAPAAAPGGFSDAEEIQLVDLLASRNRWRGYIRAFAIAMDGVAIVLAYMFAGGIWHGDLLHPQALGTIGVMLPAYLMVGLNSRAFSLSAVAHIGRDAVLRSMRC